MALIRISGKHNMKNLAIFGSVPRIFSHQWVDDELMLSEGQKFEKGHDRRDSAIQILVPGFISHRKNPLEAISACAELRINYGYKIDLYFKGSVTPGVLNEIKNTGHAWVFVDDVFLGRNEYLESLRRSDLVLLPYANRGSSGVVLETLAMGGSVAIYGNRHWKNLSLISRGKLILLKRGKTGIVRSLSRKLNEIPEDRRPIIFERTRDSALEFLTRKRIS
jgi:glycosyltransferase involved in cell wall biosynthesis